MLLVTETLSCDLVTRLLLNPACLTTRLFPYPVADPACLTTHLLPDPVDDPCLPDYPPAAGPCWRPLPAWLAACRWTLLPTPRLPDYPPAAGPCCRPIACPTTRLLPTHRLSDYPPVADPSPVRLPACCRPIACPTTRLLPTHCLSDYPPVADPSLVRLPACCRPIACPTTRLLPTHRLSDYPPVADQSPVRLPACCRPIACPTARLLLFPRTNKFPVFSSHLRLPVFSVWVHSSCAITFPLPLGSWFQEWSRARRILWTPASVSSGKLLTYTKVILNYFSLFQCLFSSPTRKLILRVTSSKAHPLDTSLRHL